LVSRPHAVHGAGVLPDLRVMSCADSPTRHDASPEAAIAAIREFDGPILLDLDETLYLRNSTEDFLDSARPRLLALILMCLLDAVKPWRWTGGEATRDVWRVRTITTFFFWIGAHWKDRARVLADQFTNKRLVDAVNARTSRTSSLVVVTVGFDTVVRPIIAAMGLSEATIVAARTNSFEDRRRGKLSLTVEALGRDVVARALATTDSIQDLPLLDVCRRPLRTVWPDARFCPALADVYLPGRYISCVKRPGSRYIVNGILREDYAYWVMCSISLATNIAFHVIGLWFLLISFWSIYERGYVDNDLIAAGYETDPILSQAFHDTPVATPRLEPWGWAAVSGAFAIAFLRYPQHPQLADFGKWLAVLVGTHGWFWIYNRYDKNTRIWLYMGLQFARGAALTALVSISAVGAAGLGVLIISRWLRYYIYRLARAGWPDIEDRMIKLLLFSVLMLLLLIADGRAQVWNRTALALLTWIAFEARREIVSIAKSALRLDRRRHHPQSGA
jgi:phosphoserine phosphatase